MKINQTYHNIPFHFLYKIRGVDPSSLQTWLEGILYPFDILHHWLSVQDTGWWFISACSKMKGGSKCRFFYVSFPYWSFIWHRGHVWPGFFWKCFGLAFSFATFGKTPTRWFFGSLWSELSTIPPVTIGIFRFSFWTWSVHDNHNDGQRPKIKVSKIVWSLDCLKRNIWRSACLCHILAKLSDQGMSRVVVSIWGRTKLFGDLFWAIVSRIAVYRIFLLWGFLWMKQILCGQSSLGILYI